MILFKGSHFKALFRCLVHLSDSGEVAFKGFTVDKRRKHAVHLALCLQPSVKTLFVLLELKLYSHLTS